MKLQKIVLYWVIALVFVVGVTAAGNFIVQYGASNVFTVDSLGNVNVTGDLNVSKGVNITGGLAVGTLPDCDADNEKLETDPSGIFYCGVAVTGADPLAIRNNTDANLTNLRVLTLNGTDIAEYNYSVQLSDYLTARNLSDTAYYLNQTSNASLYLKKGGTMSDTLICTWDAANDEVDCGYTDLNAGANALLNNSPANITNLLVNFINGTDIAEYNYSILIDTVNIVGTEMSGTIGAMVISADLTRDTEVPGLEVNPSNDTIVPAIDNYNMSLANGAGINGSGTGASYFTIDATGNIKIVLG